MEIAVYESSLESGKVEKIIEKNPQSYDMVIYISSASKKILDESESFDGLTEDEARNIFSSGVVLTLEPQEILDIFRKDDYSPDFARKMAKLINKLLLSSSKECNIDFYLNQSVESYAYYSLIAKLISLFGISVSPSICYCSTGKTGIENISEFSLPKIAPFDDACNDKDTMALLLSIYFMSKTSVAPESKKAVTISKIASILGDQLPSIRGQTRGFQGVYKRLNQKAKILMIQGMLTSFSLNNHKKASFYSATALGKLVADISLFKEVLDLLNEDVRDFFKPEAGNITKINEKIKKYQRLKK